MCFEAVKRAFKERDIPWPLHEDLPGVARSSFTAELLARGKKELLSDFSASGQQDLTKCLEALMKAFDGHTASPGLQEGAEVLLETEQHDESAALGTPAPRQVLPDASAKALANLV